MKKIFLNCVLFTAVILTSLSVNAQERKVFPNNNSVSIVLPKEFQQVDFFDGFYHYPTGCSVQLNEIDSVAYNYIASGFTPEVLEPQGVTLLEKRKFTTNSGLNGEMIFLKFTVTQDTISRDFQRIVVLVGDLNKTAIININYPMMVKDMVYNVIMDAITSIRFENQ